MGGSDTGSAELAARTENKKAKRRRGGFLIGALAGVLIGLLLAPKSGKETRAQLFGEGGLGSQVDRLRSAVGAGKGSAADQSEALRRKIEETRERLRRQMDLSGEEMVGGEDAGSAAPPAG